MRYFYSFIDSCTCSFVHIPFTSLYFVFCIIIIIIIIIFWFFFFFFFFLGGGGYFRWNIFVNFYPDSHFYSNDIFSSPLSVRIIVSSWFSMSCFMFLVCKLCSPIDIRIFSILYWKMHSSHRVECILYPTEMCMLIIVSTTLTPFAHSWRWIDSSKTD